MELADRIEKLSFARQKLAEAEYAIFEQGRNAGPAYLPVNDEILDVMRKVETLEEELRATYMRLYVNKENNA